MEVEPLISLNQFVISFIVFLIVARVFAELVVLTQNKKAQQVEINQQTEQTNTHAYYNKKIG